MITVFYEDHRGRTASFPLHEFVVACVMDDLRGANAAPDWYQLTRAFDHQPKNGNAKVLMELSRNLDALLSAGPVVALLDADRIHELFKHGDDALTPRACLRQRSDAIRKRYLAVHDADAGRRPSATRLVFLRENTETLVRALRPHGSALEVDDLVFERALAKQRDALGARDQIFSKARAERYADVRSRVRAAVGDLDYLARTLKELLPPDLREGPPGDEG